MSASPELGGKCRARRDDRGTLAYTGQNYFGVLPILIISILMCLLTLAPSDGLRFVIFPLFPVMQGQFFYASYRQHKKNPGELLICTPFTGQTSKGGIFSEI